MARNDTEPFSFQRDHAPFGTSFGLPSEARRESPRESWRALASGMVATALMVAAVISAFALVDAVVAPQPALVARKAPASTEQEARRACVLPPDRDVTAPMQVDPALFTAD
jgi:hypothetical protein